MRLIYILISLVSIFFLCTQTSCRQGGDVLKGEIGILDVRDSIMPKEDLDRHEAYDVVVCRYYFMGGTYTVRYYQNENDTLRCHSAYLNGEEDFDKVQYCWLNDTTVTLKLFSTHSTKEATYKVWGYGPRSSLEWLD